MHEFNNGNHDLRLDLNLVGNGMESIVTTAYIILSKDATRCPIRRNPNHMYLYLKLRIIATYLVSMARFWALMPCLASAKVHYEVPRVGKLSHIHTFK